MKINNMKYMPSGRYFEYEGGYYGVNLGERVSGEIFYSTMNHDYVSRDTLFCQHLPQPLQDAARIWAKSVYVDNMTFVQFFAAIGLNDE